MNLSTLSKKLVFYFGSCLLLLIMITVTTVYAAAGDTTDEDLHDYVVAEFEPELIFSGLVGSSPILNTPFYDGDFVLSAPPGVHEQPFDLIVSIPSATDAVIYFTIDGSDPMPGEDRFVARGDRIIQMSGKLPEDGMIGVHDRTGYWQYAVLTHHSEQWWSERRRVRNVLPADGAEILQGTAFRFRGFVDGTPVTEIITTTYIIVQNADVGFANRIIAVTAPYEDFLYIYSHAGRFDPETRRRIFNYEYFELGEIEYSRIFSLLGSSSLGGFGSRQNAQRTFNVHFARGELDGVITHPVFTNLYELYRFRLWNSGNAFHWDFMRDPFAQTASAGLNVPFSDNNLAIKFINGEFWGFTTIREHTSNRQFVSTRTGISMDNVAIIDRSIAEHRPGIRTDIVAEGNEAVVLELYGELLEFVRYHDMSTDYARERLFEEFFCQYNFIDYLIANTFFNNADWIYNNIRLFRAITPESDSQNPYNDGRWRFILHDLDWAPRPDAPRYRESRFSQLYELHPLMHPWELWFNDAFLVFNNQTFVEQFVGRANYVLENHYRQEQLLALHNEFSMRYMPLLPEMYNRFAIGGTVDSSIRNFHTHWLQLRRFLINREYHYRRQLDWLLERLN